MAFNGFLSFGGAEIANSARVMTYARELVPGPEWSDCQGCEDMAEILGDRPYTTPFIDQPEWFTASNPDSWDFCGFYPLEIEGLDDGTREAAVTQLATDGAVVGAPRYAGREIKVTGLLIGASDAAVQYGLSWLTVALEGTPCRSSPGCTGDHLCYYAACPPMCTDSPDVSPGGEVVRENLAPNPRGMDRAGAGWSGGGVQAWTRGYSPPRDVLATGGGSVPDSPEQVGFQYATATADATGNVYAVHSDRARTRVLVEAGRSYGARMWVFVPQGPAASLQVQARGSWLDASGGRLPGSTDFTVEQIGPDLGAGWHLLSGMTPVAPAGAVGLSIFPWWTGYAAGAPQVTDGQTIAWAARIVDVDQVPASYFDGGTPSAGPVEFGWADEQSEPWSVSQMLTAAGSSVEPFWLCDGGPPQDAARNCSYAYERTLYQVTTTGGPTVVERYDMSCAQMVRVEFTMVAGVPWAYSTAIAAVPTDANPIPEPVTVPNEVCDVTPLPPLVDPDCPAIPPPPRPPTINVSCVDDPDQWLRYEVPLANDLLPAFRDAVPIINLTTGASEARQVRVRFYPNPFGFPVADLDECNHCGEFVVTYIPPNSTMVIDGTRRWATTEVPGGLVYTANHLMASSAGGPVEWPLLGCGTGYSMVVDVSPTTVRDLTPQICIAARV